MKKISKKTNKAKSVVKKTVKKAKSVVKKTKSMAKKAGAKGIKTSAAYKLLHDQFPEKVEAVQKLKDQGSQILDEARELITEASENIPASAKKTLKSTQKKVAAQFKEHPKLATAAAAVVGVGAAIAAKRLISSKQS